MKKRNSSTSTRNSGRQDDIIQSSLPDRFRAVSYKVKKLLPFIISIVILISVTAVSSVRRTAMPVDSQSVGTTDEINYSTVDEAKIEIDEMRGVWISYLELTMENESDKSENAFRKKFDKIAENCKGYGLNTMIVQVRPYGDALYKSEYYPWSHIMTGTQGKNPGYDPLKVMVEISKSYGIQLHAWINPYRITLNKTPNKLSSDNPYSKNKRIGLETDGGIILDPSNEEARQLIINGVVEIVNNYDISGIQFDDYFYPENIGEADKESYEKYVSSVGEKNSMKLENWRKANVNMLICQTYRAVHSLGKEVAFGISPQGNIDNNKNLFADVKTWCTVSGFVDYIAPQIYFSLDNPALTFEEALNSWNELDFDKNVKLYVGLAGYKAGSDSDDGTWAYSNDILAEEYKIIKNDNRAEGFILYSYQSIIDSKCREEMQNLRNQLH